MQKAILKIIIKHIFYILCICLILALLYFLKIPCFFRFFTGIPCPSCGMTRAFLSLLRLDFSISFYYHPLLIPALVAGFIAIHMEVPLFRFSKKFCNVYLWLFIVALLVTYAVRVLTHTIP